jgi:agmatinase
MNKHIKNFLGISDEQADYAKAKAAVLSIPYEATVSYGGGTMRGPAAIIDASDHVELYDEELGLEPYTVGVATPRPIDVEGLATSKLADRIAPAVKKVLSDGKWPLILGGEHSITPALLHAYEGHRGKLTVVQFDAHADLRDSYEGDRMSHACAMARARELFPAVQVGIRSMSEGEVPLAKRHAGEIFYAHEMKRDNRWMERALSKIATDEVYITFDVDALDASVMPATGTPEPGGMNWWQCVDFLKMLFKEKDVVGMDIVELAPIEHMHAYDFLIAKLAYKCLGLKFFC